jgi:hypothetical protein
MANYFRGVIMNKDNPQSVWDHCLVHGWFNDANMKMVALQFLLIMDCDWRVDSFAQVERFNLNRCLIKQPNGDKKFTSAEIPVKGFIGRSCLDFNTLLFSGKVNAEEAESLIKSYKWKVVKTNRGWRNKESKRKRNYSRTRIIGERERIKKHDWNTTK